MNVTYIMKKYKILDIIILNEIYQLNDMIISLTFKKYLKFLNYIYIYLLTNKIIFIFYFNYNF